MDFNDTPAEAKFRTEVRTWLKQNATPKINGVAAKRKLPEAQQLQAAKHWQKKIYDAGWACITWPKAYGGRGGTQMELVIWREEVADYDELDGFFTIGHGMCGPALMAYATEEQKRHFLPRLASGEDVWCQLFSEPGAGSDVAALKTRAELTGKRWKVNGQKVWTSGAHFSDYGIVLCRTDPTVPKHQGITFFFVDMKQEGVTAQPIKQADGGAHFNEVFFNNAEIPDTQRLGQVGGGWKGALTVLMSERLAVGSLQATGFPELLSLVQRLPLEGGFAIDNAAVADKLADWYVKHAGLKHTNSRILSAISRGAPPGPEASIGKLVAAPMNQDINSYAVQLLGMNGMVTDPELAEKQAHFQKEMLFAPGIRLAGGTDEVMRNIIAEQVLGMPQDKRDDKDVPFNEVPVGV
jgi:alkylation response protein AidB-like acyl-CoA dehydrogenase